MPDKPSFDETITDIPPSDEGEVRKLYDDFSSDYNSALSEWGYTAPDVVANYLCQTVSVEEAVLDAGCGTGLTGEALSRKGFTSITGTDLSPESVEQANQTGFYHDTRVLNLSEPLPFASGHFGGAICVGVLSYIPDAEPVLTELLRVLKPGGTLVFTQRDDHVKKRNIAELSDRMHATGSFRRLVESEPQSYLPNNPSFADNIGVQYFVWRRRRGST